MKLRSAMPFHWIAAVVLAATILAAAQAAYQPKFPGDPARSESEAAALAYMRTTLRAQHAYKKKYGHYATSLAELVHSGSFTHRMTNTQRGDYTVSFRAKKEKDTFQLALTPEHVDAEHRSFYAEEDGIIHGDEQNAASETSPVVK
ncbi:MAG: hypothetical protein LAO03_12815 [Acidobacteriia bacterium]|nr:hypothetical protein [Terriglobia bacterium]